MGEMNDDQALLREYARGNSEPAFATLVSRYVNLVYSVALRQVGDPHVAEEVTQSVFIILARKAGSLGDRTVLPGWLCRTARYAGANALTIQRRRQRREQEAFMQTTMDGPEPEAWPQIAPLLDAAMGKLGQKDHDALVLRYFGERNFREVGAALGTSEEAARVRVGRALDKLRRLFAKRGVMSTTSAIERGLAGHSVQAAPAALAATATALALAKGAAAGGSTLTLVKGALKIMAWSNAKTAVTAGVALLVAAGTTTVIVKEIGTRPEPWQILDPDAAFVKKAPAMVKIVPAQFPGEGSHQVGVSDGRTLKSIGIGIQARTLIEEAYGFSSTPRIIYNVHLPDGEYDFIDTVPKNSKEALQRAVRDKFGVVARREMVETNVLLLEVKTSPAPGLTAATNQSSSVSIDRGTGHGTCSFTRESLSQLADYIEGTLKVPVIDHTGLTNEYEVHLDWKWPKDGSENDEHDAFRKAVGEQLGLELVPTNMPIEMLVVDKAR